MAKPIVTAFRKEDVEVIRIGTMALQLQCLTMPLAAQITMANMFSQTTGYPLRASHRGTATAGHLPDSDFTDFPPCLRAFRPANVSAPQ